MKKGNVTSMPGPVPSAYTSPVSPASGGVRRQGAWSPGTEIATPKLVTRGVAIPLPQVATTSCVSFRVGAPVCHGPSTYTGPALPAPRSAGADRRQPFFWLTNHQIARNHSGRGVRVRSKMVPAVTEVCRPHSRHIQSPRLVSHPVFPPQEGQTNPSGQRIWAR